MTNDVLIALLPPQPSPPLTLEGDLTLRACADGATARVHRDLISLHSRVLREMLDATIAHGDDDAVLPLRGALKTSCISW